MKQFLPALITLFPSALCGVLQQPDDDGLLLSRALSTRQDSDAALRLVHNSAGGYFVEVTIGDSQTLSIQVRSDTFYTWVPASNSSTCDEGSCSYGNCESFLP